MLLHPRLQRRHTWPFELVEIVCQEVHTDPEHPHNQQHQVLVQNNIAGEDTLIPHSEEENPHQNPLHYDNEEPEEFSESTTLLSPKKAKHLDEKGGRKNKNKSESGCTCSSKSSSEHVQENALCNNNINIDIKPSNLSAPDVVGDKLNNLCNEQSNQTLTLSPSAQELHDRLREIQNGQQACRNDLVISGESQSCSGRKGTGFQPIQDKFNFLSKKTRDSRKKKVKEKERKESSSSTNARILSHTPPPPNPSIPSSTPIKHKDFCPHSTKYQEKKALNKDLVTSPQKSNASTSTCNSSSVFRKSKDLGFTSNSNSSNTASPSHSQHCSSQGPPSQGNKSEGVASIGNSSGSNSKGSLTVVTANIINLNSHHETEGKIPQANGTATGALSLQVNTANGEIKKTITLWQNYYPEGGFGWVVVFTAFIVQAINHGLQLGVSSLLLKVGRRYRIEDPAQLGLLSSLSMFVALFLSPVWVSLCKTKSTRLSGVFGGLLASLGCLFSSFASQFHQLFFSYGGFIGVGVGLSRDASTLMVGQYFKRKREMVEIIVVSGSGVGIALMSSSFHFTISTTGWILGLQAITGMVLLTFFLGTCYRSASLYHPQRRAILHLKNQKKKVKDITKREDKPPFLDFSCLRSKTLQILLLSSAFVAFGINSPLLYLGWESQELQIDQIRFVLLHVYVGVAWVLGCCLFGLIAVQKNQECRVSKQYLCQVASVICGISIIAFTAVKGYNGYVIFSWVYGFSLGGYNYALKTYTYERVRARHFARAWSFVQSSQALPVFIGTPVISILNAYFGRKCGYYFSAGFVFLGSAFLFLTDVRRRRLSRRKANNSSMKTCSTSDTTQTPKMRRLSFAFPVEPISPHHPSKPDSGEGQGSVLDPAYMSKELTCISEEGLAELDFQDIYFDDWAEYLGGDCITSCNKVENCLASEYDPDFSLLLDKRTRRWSRNSIPFGTTGGGNLSSHSHLLPQGPAVINSVGTEGSGEPSTTTAKVVQPIREIPVFRSHTRGSRVPVSQRSITVIDEASV